jgi:hypothetical protein
MGDPAGYNPLRWNCESSGCYNTKLRPRIEEFAGCFPGRNAMSDVDGIVEIAGRFLLLEWKARGGSVQIGQRIMFERLTGLSPKITVIVVSGHPREMRIESVQVFHGGKSQPPEVTDFDGLKARVSAWANRASLARVRPSQRADA